MGMKKSFLGMLAMAGMVGSTIDTSKNSDGIRLLSVKSYKEMKNEQYLRYINTLNRKGQRVFPFTIDNQLVFARDLKNANRKVNNIKKSNHTINA